MQASPRPHAVLRMKSPGDHRRQSPPTPRGDGEGFAAWPVRGLGVCSVRVQSRERWLHDCDGLAALTLGSESQLGPKHVSASWERCVMVSPLLRGAEEKGRAAVLSLGSGIGQWLRRCCSSNAAAPPCRETSVGVPILAQGSFLFTAPPDACPWYSSYGVSSAASLTEELRRGEVSPLCSPLMLWEAHQLLLHKILGLGVPPSLGSAC